MASEGEPQDKHVLRYIDRGDDLILYDPNVAARAKEVLNLAESVSTWGALRRLQSRSPELVKSIIAFLWDQWDIGDGAWEFGFGEEDPNLPTIRDIAEFTATFPDNRPLTVTTANENGPLLMSPFDPVAMGVPEELHRFYVAHSTMVSAWTDPASDDLAEIRRAANDVGWTLDEGDYREVPHFS